MCVQAQYPIRHKLQCTETHWSVTESKRAHQVGAVGALWQLDQNCVQCKPLDVFHGWDGGCFLKKLDVAATEKKQDMIMLRKQQIWPIYTCTDFTAIAWPFQCHTFHIGACHPYQQVSWGYLHCCLWDQWHLRAWTESSSVAPCWWIEMRSGQNTCPSIPVVVINS